MSHHDLFDEDEQPSSPEIINQLDDLSEEVTRTPLGLRLTSNRNRRRLSTSDPFMAEKSGSNQELVKSVAEIKSMIESLCDKVDKNEKCLRELQQSCSR